MTVVLAGASGLIGRALEASLRADGVPVRRLVRGVARGADEISWTPSDALDPGVLAGARAVVCLNGASIGRLPWTRGYRVELERSRITPTTTLASALAELGADAPLFLSASGVGYYGSRPGVELDETASAGTGFLAELCVRWEDAARRAGDRVALLRTAPVLHPQGVLKPLIALTRLGLGGPLGSGRQLWPWISLEDEVAGIRHIIDHGLTGPVNLTGPTPATASDIGRAVARTLKRPFLLPAPAFALRLALGIAADDLLLADARVTPEVLADTGFTFTHPTAQSAVGAALGA